MIAHVVPLTRLPRRFSFFDYRIPEGMTTTTGDLVRISFRGRNITGIVLKTSEKTEQKKLAEVHTVIVKDVITENHLARLERIATCMQQSLASLLFAALPPFFERPLQKTSHRATHNITLKEEDTRTLHNIGAYIKEHRSCAIQGDQETAIALAYLLAKSLVKNEQLLILVPRDRDAEILANVLSHPHTGIVTGTTPQKERAHSFYTWQKGTLNVLIGTKQAALWDAPYLKHVLVLQAGNDEYANLRRNPKFDPREAARLLAKERRASYISIDTLPRIEDCEDSLFLSNQPAPDLSIISLKDRNEKTPHPLITTSLLEAIKIASQSQKKVLLFLNRKGAAKRLQCTACGETPLCGTCGNLPTVRANDLICGRCGTEMWVPKACPLCEKPKLTFVGVGGEKITADLQTLFPDLFIQNVEKGNDRDWKTADIIVATEHLFANLITPFTRYGFGLVADLMADLPVNGVNFRATEHTSRQALRLAFLAKRERATCIFQTWIPERFPEVLASEFIIQEERKLRKQYELPPFGTIYTTKETTFRNPTTIPNDAFTYDGSY
jgi:primosomal protein N'